MYGLSLAKDIMVTRLVTLPPEMNVLSGIARLLNYNITGAPVVDSNRRFLGMFSEKCCMSVLAETIRHAAEKEKDRVQGVKAKDFMVKRLITLSPETDVFKAIGLLLKHRISGTPVIDREQNFQGVFSEKFSMRVLIDSAYDQLPTTQVSAFMNTDFGRTITEDTDLLSVAQIFLDTPYRRVAVLRDGKLVGQISRRDVLYAEHHLSAVLRKHEKVLQDKSARDDLSETDFVTSHDPLPTVEVSKFMDTKAKTINEKDDLLTIAQIFLNTNYRRLPVLRDGALVGQISRRDILHTAYKLMKIPSVHESSILYLSALLKNDEAPMG